VVFPYKYEPRYKCWFPIIPLKMHGEAGRLLETYAYVDSGAAFSVFQPFEAAVLGLDIARGKPGTLTAGDGRLLRCSIHILRLEVGTHRFTGTIGFSKDLRIGFNVLGLAGFFDRFREIAFHHGQRCLFLRP